MNITAPVNNINEVQELIDSGANELYLGYLSGRWVKKYSILASQNRRYFKESSFNRIKDVKTVCKIAHTYNIPVFLTMNSPFYTKSQYSEVISDINKLRKFVDAVIVADIPLILKIRDRCKVILSTVAASLNSRSAQFYEKLGVSRIILPRHLTFDEIKTIRKKTRTQLEVFIMFDWCKNIDGLCTFQHGLEPRQHGCMYLNEYRSGKIRIDNRIKNLRFTNFCAGCLLDKFAHIGINAAKIAGRRLPTQIKVKALNFLKDPSPNNYFTTFSKRCPVICNAY